MKIKVSEATGIVLDWLVAKCESKLPASYDDWRQVWPTYSTNWTHGGPIIDRIRGFQFKDWLESKSDSRCEAHIHNYEGDWIQFGPTMLIAAMRCYVASKLGEEVEMPDELC